MPTAWRLIKTKYLATAWDGEGAGKSGGRWNSVGVPVVYVSETLSLALVEILAHLTIGVLPAYSAIRVDFDESIATSLEAQRLPKGWRVSPPPITTQQIGDGWVRAATSAALRVPSVIVPSEFNYVLNPAHPDFARLVVGPARPFPFDARFAKT
jgi:RES domain-containing protein